LNSWPAVPAHRPRPANSRHRRSQTTLPLFLRVYVAREGPELGYQHEIEESDPKKEHDPDRHFEPAQDVKTTRFDAKTRSRH
jgi:hypothetical protein